MIIQSSIIKYISLFAIVLMSTTKLSAEPFYTFGIGNASCATWLNTPQKKNEGIAYIFGVWSAANANSPIGKRLVGQGTDGDGVIGEVQKVCVGNPSMSLVIAALNAYYAMQQNGR